MLTVAVQAFTDSIWLRYGIINNNSHASTSILSTVLERNRYFIYKDKVSLNGLNDIVKLLHTILK